MEKLIISAAICGAEVTKEQNPAVPYTVGRDCPGGEKCVRCGRFRDPSACALGRRYTYAGQGTFSGMCGCDSRSVS